jgi:preprotein translocase subunit SecD
MKAITLSIIAIYIFGLFAMGFTHKANPGKNILIQTNDKKASVLSLEQSAKVIAQRLNDFSTVKSEVSVIAEKNQIQITVADNADMKLVENLITNKGGLALYETYSRKSLSEILKGDDHLFSFFRGSKVNDSIGKIGCVPVSEMGKVNDYLNTLNVDPSCKFAWTRNFDSSDVCLYALKTSAAKASLIDASDIESVKYSQNKASKFNAIEIRLKQSAVELWADATKRNIGKAIAIVLDNDVISAPKVLDEIKGGHLMITGNFNQAEAKYIAALGNNGELPLNFHVVK